MEVQLYIEAVGRAIAKWNSPYKSHIVDEFNDIKDTINKLSTDIEQLERNEKHMQDALMKADYDTRALVDGICIIWTVLKSKRERRNLLTSHLMNLMSIVHGPRSSNVVSTGEQPVVPGISKMADETD
jgi:hypothetical protein